MSLSHDSAGWKTSRKESISHQRSNHHPSPCHPHQAKPTQTALWPWPGSGSTTFCEPTSNPNQNREKAQKLTSLSLSLTASGTVPWSIHVQSRRGLQFYSPSINQPGRLGAQLAARLRQGGFRLRMTQTSCLSDSKCEHKMVSCWACWDPGFKRLQVPGGHGCGLDPIPPPHVPGHCNRWILDTSAS